MKLRALFSLITGEIITVEEDELRHFDHSHVILKEKPKGDCKKCYGRFYIGKEINKNYYIPCPRCMRKYADWDAMKNGEVMIEQPKTTTELADAAFNEAMKNVPGK